MKSNSSRLKFDVATGVLLLGMSCGGCYSLREGHEYFPPGAINQPVGTLTRQWQSAQADRARQSGLVLYEAAWIGDSDRLGPAAQSRLAELCHQDGSLDSLITLETSHDSARDEQRKQAILNFANSHGVILDPQLIAVAAPDSNILYSEESTRVSRGMMQGNRRDSGLDGFNSGGFPGFPASGSSNGFGVGR